VQRASPNKQTGRDGWKPDTIVCHITEGAYGGAVEWLCNPKAVASAHFVVAQDGRVTQLVSIEDTAWCNGTSPNPAQTTYSGNSTLKTVRDRKTNANLYTVSIEHEGIWATTKGRLTLKQLGTTIELVAWIRSEVKRIYNVVIPLDREHIVGHYQISPINKPNCPGAGFQFDTILKVLHDRETTVPAVTEAQVIKWLDDEGIIVASTGGDTAVTYRTLRWAIYKLEHRT
jgi:N-acetyl-anhydromuramyl-L-alanine amidase AmpD